MKNLQIGDEVKIEVMGILTEIRLNGNKEIVYKVESPDRVYGFMAMNLKESNIMPLEEPHAK